ncbi:hypothetical protein TREES_T100010400 [Tupaia chinensis]|uniref:Uncharacterized protein n=1 Tax=Tupaia chinensis TaxID=246437 RepID=L9LC85_TUPCH|nr:hypothetical protein TREES_T100010400 [Tupaia chinensis]
METSSEALCPVRGPASFAPSVPAVSVGALGHWVPELHLLHAATPPLGATLGAGQVPVWTLLQASQWKVETFISSEDGTDVRSPAEQNLAKLWTVFSGPLGFCSPGKEI